MPFAVPLCAVLFFLFVGVAPAAESVSIVLTGKVMTTVTRSALMPFNAVVDEVLVKPGDAVQEGVPLLRYHLQDAAGRALQREVTTGAGTENLKGQVLDMERQLAETIAQRNKARQLAASGLGSQQASGRLEDDVRSLQQRIELLRRTIQKNESNFVLRLKELESYYGEPIREGQQLPLALALTSPISGYVLSLESTLHSGSELAAGSAPVKVGQLNPVVIEVPVYEGEVSDIKAGDTATVEIPSLSNKKFTAKISEISWVSNDMSVSNPSYYTVELIVPNPELELKPGFKAVVYFKGTKQ
ncbi:MAG: efflux RND transporter periplasmic adaptor subunit [Desulfovibrio sp.]|jgi:multidrug efflux pump subunit AcrA (membrane-fusion protein)|nr:efflux RND transporter periplasmic adaptor subunit [Desulfovibrio sp.]